VYTVQKLVMGPGQKFLTLVGSAIFGLGLDLENFPLKIPNFSIFSLRIKKYLGQVGQVCLLITAGQKYDRASLGQGRAHL